MPSLNAIAVANEVKETLENGSKIVLKDIIKKHGYSDAIATVPNKVTNTDSYQKAITIHTEKMNEHREKLLQAMMNKDLSKEDYRILSEGYDRMNKNYLLATGKATDNIATTINIVSYTDISE